MQTEELQQLHLLRTEAKQQMLGLQRLADGLQAKAASQKTYIVELEASFNSLSAVNKALEQKALALQGIVDGHQEIDFHEANVRSLRNARGRARRKLRQLDDPPFCS